MASKNMTKSAQGNKKSASASNHRKRTNQKSNQKMTKRKKNTRKRVSADTQTEAVLIAVLAVSIFFFLCVINVIKGSLADIINQIMFGLFGLLAYIIPVFVFLSIAFELSNRGNSIAIMKLICGIILVFLVGNLSFLFNGQEELINGSNWIKILYEISAETKKGGGVLFGGIGHLLYQLIGFWGSIFFIVVTGIICIVIITEKSFLSGVKKGSKYILDNAKEDFARYRENNYDEDFDEDEYVFDEKEEQRKIKLKDTQKMEKPVRRMDRKAEGVISMTAATLKVNSAELGIKADIHEIKLSEEDMQGAIQEKVSVEPEDKWNYSKDFLQKEKPLSKNFLEELEEPVYTEKDVSVAEELLVDIPEPVTEQTTKKQKVTKKITDEEKEKIKQDEMIISSAIERQEETKKYVFPPLSLLERGKESKSDTSKYLKETAYRLQQTLLNFGVKVTITDISQGPSVTRYELQPEQGVKVSKIVGLADDIKLNLAATDIRIEAPIPGKAAVGIEVPNKENSTVKLRDLLETDEFQKFPSNLAFAVGKDIGGKVTVTDIAKMPHVLIAGATGSGKSVCINTIIMSILYKANPNDVKMIMIDPKVVELSVYNGIPHLMIPVVTDPKKASAALHWGVAEMTDRYNKFAEMNVRDLKGYNQAAEKGKLGSDGQPIQKMPQIVIIVDELADLMMVAANEVEESICRLAQLARAAGIHLIIATQRPSVDVITGLIKANMPSRIAFSVSSGVDSRTILDMNGAEKLLGKGDMLFYPQGFAKPSRVQGAFVSDTEVSEVVDFLKNQQLGNISYSTEIENRITQSIQNSVSGSASSGGNDYDEHFIEAGRFVIEKDKASIGMLQRVFKIGFNRAARIVDQLESAGVVGAEEGTKPRKILMTTEQFEAFIEENV